MTISLVTLIGRHSYARTLLLRARGDGPPAEHEHDGRLLLRTHLLTITGEQGHVRRWNRRWTRYHAALRRRHTASDLRQEKEKQLRWARSLRRTEKSSR